MAAKDLHIVLPDEVDLHKPVKEAFDGGACMTGHKTPYTKTSCSYRWQAHKGDGSRATIYNKPPVVPQTFIRTSSYVANSGAEFPANYATRIKLPQVAGDWDLDGPTRPGVRDVVNRPVKKGENFKGDWLWPYWHNSHHLIPKGTFADKLRAVDPIEARELIPKALLKAKYNINHHVNAFILPQDQEVARFLSLPRHLRLEDSPPDVTPEYTNHIDYNINVEEKLSTIIDDYKQKCDPKTNPECEKADYTLSKEALENLSRQCMKKILAFGQTNAGDAISDMPEI